MVSTNNTYIQKIITALNNKFITKSDEAGLVKNDGTIDKNQYLTSAAIPSKTSDLTNDSGFLTNHNPIDSSLSTTSTNAVQNKVIKEALDNYYTETEVDNLLCGTTTELQGLINDAIDESENLNQSQTILLTKDYKIENDDITIQGGNINIDGNGHTIYIDSYFCLNFLETYTSLNNINFTKKIGWDCAHSLCIRTSNVKISNCNFSRNIAELTSDGIIYIDDSDSSGTFVNIIDSNFNENYGNTIYLANNDNITLNIKKCNFVNNGSDNANGAIYIQNSNNTINIRDSIFTNNIGTNYGDINSSIPLMVYNCELDANNSYNVTNISYSQEGHTHTGYESNNNKVTSWSNTTTNTNYPSEKLVKDSLDNKVDKETGKGLFSGSYSDLSNKPTIPDVSGKENTSNKVTSWSTTTTDTHYPSEKLVKSSLDNKMTISTYISENANLNNYTTVGTYYADNNNRAQTLSNTPWGNQSSSATAFALVVLKHAGVRQILYPYGTNDQTTFIRNYYNGTWGSWIRLATGKNNQAKKTLIQTDNLESGAINLTVRNGWAFISVNGRVATGKTITNEKNLSGTIDEQYRPGYWIGFPCNAGGSIGTLYIATSGDNIHRVCYSGSTVSAGSWIRGTLTYPIQTY